MALHTLCEGRDSRGWEPAQSNGNRGLGTAGSRSGVRARGVRQGTCYSEGRTPRGIQRCHQRPPPCTCMPLYRTHAPWQYTHLPAPTCVPLATLYARLYCWCTAGDAHLPPGVVLRYQPHQLPQPGHARRGSGSSDDEVMGPTLCTKQVHAAIPHTCITPIHPHASRQYTHMHHVSTPTCTMSAHPHVLLVYRWCTAHLPPGVVLRYEAHGRPQPDHAAKGGGYPLAAAHVRACGQPNLRGKLGQGWVWG